MAFSAIHSKSLEANGSTGAATYLLDSAPRLPRWSQQPICQALPKLLDRYRWQMFFGVALCYLLGFNGQWLIEPDGGLYLNLARNLAVGRGYTYGGIRHETVYPGLPLILAGLYRLSASHIILAADVFILLCALAALALTYRLVLLAYDRPTAVLITLGVAVSHEFFQFSYEILTDMPFLTGVMAVLAGHEAIFGPRAARRSRWWDWALLAAGVALVTTTRPTMMALLLAWVAALVLALVVRRNLKAGAAICFCMAIVAAFLLFDPRRFAGHGIAGGYEQYALNQLSQTHMLATAAAANTRALLDPIITKAAFGMPLWPVGTNVVLGIVMALASAALIARRLLWGLWVILTFATVVLFVSNDRYLLPILPMMVLGWWHLVRNINLRLPNKLGNFIAFVLLLMGTGPNVAQVVGTIIHQRMRPFLAYYQNGKYEPFVHLAPEVARHTGPEAVVLCPPKTARMMAFLADRMCFEENEPFPATADLYVISDSLDADYTSWLADEHIVLEQPALAGAERRSIAAAIYLHHARMPAAPAK